MRGSVLVGLLVRRMWNMTKLIGRVTVALAAVMVCSTTVWAQYPSEVVGFEEAPLGDPTDVACHELFWAPEWSGSTANYVVHNVNDFDLNSTFRSDSMPTAGIGCLQVIFEWVSPADPDAWVRLTSYNHDVRPNPGLDTTGKVRFKITNRGYFVWGEIGICLGIRETGQFVAQMDDGGTAGDIEWVGVDTTINGIIAGSNGIVDTTASGDDIQEYGVGLDILAEGLPSGTAVISPGPNGTIDTVPSGDDETRFGYFIGTNGARRPIPAATLPVSASAYSMEWDLSTGNVYVNGTNRGGGIAGMTGNGVLDAANNRGTLEHLAITNVASDTENNIDFAIDELQFEATGPDPVVPPVIEAPVYVSDTQVTVLCHDDASQVALFINESPAGTQTPSGGEADFSVSLTVGDVLTATQTVYGGTSDPSRPVIVYANGVVMADNFDNYNNNADLLEFWDDSYAAPDPADARVRLQTGGAASCPNFLREDNPASSNASRLYWDLGSVNGTNAEPLWVTWNFKYTGEELAARARTRFELARFDEGTFNTGTRDEGSVSINIKNNLPGLLDQFLIGIVSTNGIDGTFTESGGWNFNYTSVERESDRWYKMQIKVDGDYVNWYIDDVMVTPASYTVAGGAAADGVPRPNSLSFDALIIGEGYSNNGPMMMFDNVSVTVGAGGTLHPFGDPEVAAPNVEEILYPGLTSVTVNDVDTNATEVEVFSNAVSIGSVTTTGFESTTVVVPVSPALVIEADITATQTVGGETSCHSIPVEVSIPVLTIDDDELIPGATTITVSGVAEGFATAIKVYANDVNLVHTETNPATDPITFTVPAFVDGDIITVTQVIGGIEGDPSEGKIVRNPPNMSLTMTLCLDENGDPADADYEFVGAAKAFTNAPVGKPLLPIMGQWQNIEFSLIPGEEPVTGWFGGDGSLTPDGGNYHIDSFFFSIDSNGASVGPYTIYLDHLYIIDNTGTKVVLDDSEDGNPYPGRRYNTPGEVVSWDSVWSSEASKDGFYSNKTTWSWGDEENTNYNAARPEVRLTPFADTARAVGCWVLFEGESDNPVPRPTILAPIVGNVDTVRVQDVDPTATSVDLYLNGVLFGTEVPVNGIADFDTSSTTLEMMDEFTATQTTPAGTSDKAIPRVVSKPPAPTLTKPIVALSTKVIVNDVMTLFNGTASVVTVYGNGSPIGSAAGGTESVEVTVPSLTQLTQITATQTVNGIESDPSVVAIVAVLQTPCGVAFEDDFDTDTSPNYTINTSSEDTSVDWAWDYSSMGIPPAPHSSGTTLGVRFGANIVDPAAAECIMITPTGYVFGGDYKLTFDMWINVNGPLPGGGTGSTEHVCAGVGYDGVTLNNTSTGSGGWFAVDGDGGETYDYRAYKNSGLQYLASGQWLVDDYNANATTDNDIENYFAGQSAPTYQQNNYTQQTGSLNNGCAGFAWREVEIVVVGDTVTWTIDGLPLCRLDRTVGADFPLDGAISLGYFDRYSSVSDNPDLSFGLIDNVRVEGFIGGDCNGNDIGDGCEDISGGDWDADGSVDIDDFKAFADCLSGPGTVPAPFDSQCVDACLESFDFDSDGDIDLRDFSAFAAVLEPPM